MSVSILVGDCREVLKALPENSVHCVVTSPPYWGLRDYGLSPQVWDDGFQCDGHEWGNLLPPAKPGPGNKDASLSSGLNNPWRNEETRITKSNSGAFCRKCNAWRGCLGLEPFPEHYVYHLMTIMRLVRRVLRPDGTLWLNLGDSYGTDKNLLGIPWQVAFALQTNGWWLRQDIIWSKPNPMPESITDRCTKSHEYLFLLSKSKRYFYDAHAIREYAQHGRSTGHNKRSVWTITTKPFPEAHFATFPPNLIKPCILAGTSEYGCCSNCGAPWVRKTERISQGFDGSKYGERAVDATGGAISGGTSRSTLGSSNGKLVGQRHTVAWAPSCNCLRNLVEAEVDRCVVLDPFGGAGTTGLVADEHGRDALLIEINPEYADMACRRIKYANPFGYQVEMGEHDQDSNNHRFALRGEVG